MTVDKGGGGKGNLLSYWPRFVCLKSDPRGVFTQCSRTSDISYASNTILLKQKTVQKTSLKQKTVQTNYAGHLRNVRLKPCRKKNGVLAPNFASALCRTFLSRCSRLPDGPAV